MLKPQDILVVLKLITLADQPPPSFAALAESLSLSTSETFACIGRATHCRLLRETALSSKGLERFRPSLTNLKEFLASGLPYVFPAQLGKAQRGFVTAQDAPPLSMQIARPPEEPRLVWPHPEGNIRGLALKPLYPSVPEAALRDPKLYEWLALADAIRSGDPRVRLVAASEIGKRLIQLDHELRTR